MNVIQEFSRFANLYETHNTIQSQVAQKLVSIIEPKEYKHILDIGCGSGAIYKNLVKIDIPFKKITVADFSKAMLSLHPSSNNIQKLFFDFNSIESFREVSHYKYDIVISSSALQWSQDLDTTLKEISKLSNRFYFAIFTSNTFKTLHKIGKVQSPIYSENYIKNSTLNYYNASFETVNYQLNFDSVYKMLRYIKQSGVSGGKKQLSYQEIKRVIKEYPLDYLEFEVLFIKATKK
jgi:malonyl-CoA O-methyltransferase